MSGISGGNSQDGLEFGCQAESTNDEVISVVCEDAQDGGFGELIKSNERLVEENRRLAGQSRLLQMQLDDKVKKEHQN